MVKMLNGTQKDEKVYKGIDFEISQKECSFSLELLSTN